MDENALRAGWKTGARCQIYSNSKKKWFGGEVAQIFTDEEGEWLEVRYDKSMSKQVQRYSSDIRPHPEDLKQKKKPKKKAENSPFNDQEMKLRQSWDKGDEVEIFSNTHQEWYLGEVVDIIKDDEGEWLNCVWARANGEAMSKQVQRFSTDVRPVQDDSTSGDSSGDDSPHSNAKNKTNNSMTPAQKTKVLSQKIAQRKTNFRRRAPPFSRTLRPSTFTYPATSAARRSRKLLDLEETNEKNQHVKDSTGKPMPRRNSTTPRLKIEIFKPQQVREFIRNLGSAYEKYANKFRNINGRQLLKFTENNLTKFGINAKLHRHKILIEIHRNEGVLNASDVDILNWRANDVQQWCQKTKVLDIYSKQFFNHGIDGMLLFELDSKDLAVIGVKKTHQQRVLDIIAKFAKLQFPTNDDEKDEEPNGNKIDLSPENENKGKKKRDSIVGSHIGLANGDSNPNLLNIQNNDAIIYTMGELLLELGQMFKVGKVQQLTTRLQTQLTELQANSAHPQMLKRGSLKINTAVAEEDMHSNNNMSLTAKMQDRMDTSPTGVNEAWLKTQAGSKGHKRRKSLSHNIGNLDLNDDDEEDDDDISDIE